MTRKDGSTALGVLILVLACFLRAHGWEGVDYFGVPGEAFDRLVFSGGLADPFDAFTWTSHGEPLGYPDVIVGADAAKPLMASSAPIGQPGYDRDIVFSNGRFSEGSIYGGVTLVSFLSSDIAPLPPPELSFVPIEARDVSYDASYDAMSPTPVCARYRPRLATRFGWWFVDSDGDPTKVGEYQGLKSSPFVDVDALFSDGVRTIDLFATNLDREACQTGVDYYEPGFQVDIDFQRYLHRLDHDPLTNMGDIESGEEAIREDLDVGSNYAIRVQELDTSFKCNLTKKIRTRMNLRVLRKHGERQATGTQHCFCELQQGNCHVLSQPQRIDWLTLKVEPVVEGRFGPVRVEYSRPMRVFNQHDQVVTRTYGLHERTEEAYAFVPENVTQTDRLKLGVDLAASTNFYARLHTGDTHNKFRETHRRFHGFDLRLTNRSCDGVTLTGYATLNEQRNQDLPFFLPEEEEALAVPTSTVPPYGIRHPINYLRATVGAEAGWRPFRKGATWRGLGFTLGCEQGLLERDYAEWIVQDLDNPPGSVVNQDRTVYSSFHVGTTMRWSPCLETHVRYRLRVTEDPLFAVNRYYGYTNTSLPESENLVEIGSTWMPAANFMATATFGIQNRRHSSAVAFFEEDDYPITFTLWYAPTPKWSLSAGYAFYSNWINQDITFPSDTPEVEVGDTRRWNYGGQGRVLSFGGSYALTRCFALSGGAQYVWAHNAIDPLAPWPDLPEYFDVIVDRTRLNAGVDWHVYENISGYFRYIFEDYEDESVAYNSGTAHMLLTGFSAIY